MIEIASDKLSAAINPFGAELSSLRDGEGRELMTDADPAYWSGRAPLLFPIVGALNGGVYRLEGREYPLPQHGFARRLDFALIEQAPDRALFRLTDTDETRASHSRSTRLSRSRARRFRPISPSPIATPSRCPRASASIPPSPGRAATTMRSSSKRTSPRRSARSPAR